MRFVSQEPFPPRSTLPSIRAGLAAHQEAPRLAPGSSELRGDTSQQEALSRSCSQVDPVAHMESEAPAKPTKSTKVHFAWARWPVFGALY